MGIRFYCPQGHKLNVKEFQAGRRGICPFCGEKILIPTRSSRPSSKEERQARRAGAAALAMTSGTSETPIDAGNAPPPPLAANANFEPHGLESAGGSRASAPAWIAEIAGGNFAARAADSIAPPAEPASPEGSAAMQDPLADSAEVVWYVRPPTGGQFGPATPEILRAWLAEGRIGTDTLVWREGWRDWREAGDVFPQLNLAFTDPLAVVNIPPQPAIISRGEPTPAPADSSRTPNGTIGLIAGLSLFAILTILGAIVFWLKTR
ncbi:MAG: DUF4339 domain-containing protein [Pirellulales bacterium]|nr:DUF4339 domain-containing protein [Pirellulales bacterium]